MIDRTNERFVFAVAKLAWEDDKGAIAHHFCSLKPVASCEDGKLADIADFPAFGEVWWKLEAHSRSYATPGTLITGKLGLSNYANQPGKDHYQVITDSTDTSVDQFFAQIIEVGNVEVSEPKQLLSSQTKFALPYLPTGRFWLHWRNNLLGPFKTNHSEQISNGYRFNLATGNQNGSVAKFPYEILDNVSDLKKHKIECLLSTNNYSVHLDGHELLKCNYHLIEKDAFSDAVPNDAQTLILESDEAVLRRLAKNLLTRKKRQQFSTYLDEMLAQLDSNAGVSEGDIKVLQDIKDVSGIQVEAAGMLARSILETGVLDEQIKTATSKNAEEYVSRNSATLQADIETRIKATRDELGKLESQQKSLNESISNRKKQAKKDVEKEIVAARKAKQAELKEIQSEIDRQKEELADQRTALQEAASSLKNNKDEVVTQFLSLMPLLEQFNLLPNLPGRDVAHTGSPQIKSGVVESRDSYRPKFELPSFITDGERADESLAEDEFLDRFRRHSEDCGFRYREIDRLAFHTSVKCGDLTIVGGPPGTGKSSIVRLYAEALHGETSFTESQRFLHVPVSPSWLDTRDVLGHVNALEGTFQPAESGIFQFLLFASEENESHGSKSGMYLACLDEMNLSHVEHYFSSFIQVLEQQNNRRYLTCFPDNVVSANCPFGKWSKIHLPKSVKFVGTVNFDETTKQLSHRLLDRANLVRLVSDRPATDLSEPTAVPPTGVPISQENYSAWLKPVAGIDSALGTLIDDLRDPLRRLGCPINPRTLTGIRLFIANYPKQEAGVALDIQLTQRVFSKLRSLFRPGVTEAVNEVLGILGSHSYEFELSRNMLAELKETEISSSFGDMDF